MLLKLYLIISIITLILSIFANIRVATNERIKDALEKKKKKSKDNKFIRFVQEVILIILPVFHIIGMFASIYLLLAEEDKVIKLFEEVSKL